LALRQLSFKSFRECPVDHRPGLKLFPNQLKNCFALAKVQRSAGQFDHPLAFLAPNLVKAAVEGRLPRGIGIERLRDPPTEWSRQFEALGLNPE
jgi:hypothetical protein